MIDRHYSFEQRVAAFWSKVQKTDTCWLWTGATHPDGYGNFGLEGQTPSAHRMAFFLMNGFWPPPDREIDHLCHIPACVRPDHLRMVTRLENVNSRICSKICHRGHPLVDPNLYYYRGPGGITRRRCRACIKITARESYLAHKGAVAI